MNLLVFEDQFVDRLSPVVTARGMMTVSCGGQRLLEMIRPLASGSSKIMVRVRSYLGHVTQRDFPWVTTNVSVTHETILINARVAPVQRNYSVMQRLAAQPVGTMVHGNGSDSAKASQARPVLALKIDASWNLPNADVPLTIKSVLQANGDKLPTAMESDEGPETMDSIDQLHDLVRIHGSELNANLQHRLAVGQYTEIANGVFSADPQFQLPDTVVADTSDGPVILETGCRVGPFVYFQGPVWLGANCKVAEHASLKEGVVAGTTCKLGGEIEATTIESYTNKQHHGFLGHSYLGSWINLGAGTCNSDLKNTYGTVTMHQAGERVNTNLQFVGCFIGDYAKTAINTSIFTGKKIGVCSMVYGTAAHDVAPFTNDARLLGKVTAVDPVVMITTQKRMFGRRNVPQQDCDRDLIEAMFRLTRDQRNGLSTEPLVL